MDFSDLDILDEFFGMGDDSNPFMMLIWFLPIILFVFYGQRIQLIITSRDIKKSMSELEQFRNDSRDELIILNKNYPRTAIQLKNLTDSLITLQSCQ